MGGGVFLNWNFDYWIISVTVRYALGDINYDHVSGPSNSPNIFFWNVESFVYTPF